MTTPIQNYNALLAAQNYRTPEIKQPKGGAGEQNGVHGVNPFTQSPAIKPAQKSAEAYEGQSMVSSIAQNKAAMAKVGLGGNPHPTETTGNRLMITDYDLARC